ncbi:MAG: hypothetical protein LBR15_11010 [Methanobrevibacter sp.]|jgi:hypothetical protein|nr:hypothetical protein [Candidatus Methanovirga australis]
MRIKKLGLMLILSYLITIMFLGFVSAEKVHVIDDKSYSHYFDANGRFLPNSAIDDGDTLKIKDMDGKNFNVNKKLFITSYNSSTKLTNCHFVFGGGSDGSSLTGINLTNQNDGHLVVISANNILLENNTIFYNGGSMGFFVVEMGSKNSKFVNNTFKRTGGSTCLHLSGENIDLTNNTVCSGTMTEQGGNVVHLMGKNFNVTGNNIIASPSNICWGIKMEANESLIDKNDIANAQIGIRLQRENNTISNNNIHDFDAILAVDYGALGEDGCFAAVGIETIVPPGIIENNTFSVNRNSTNIFAAGRGVTKYVKYLAFLSVGRNDISDFCSSNKFVMDSTYSWVFDERSYNSTNLTAFYEKNNNVGSSKVKGPYVKGGGGIYSEG